MVNIFVLVENLVVSKGKLFSIVKGRMGYFNNDIYKLFYGF